MPAFIAVCGLLAALPASAWTGFYGGPAAEPAAPTGARPGAADDGPDPAGGICVREILKAQLRHGIPDNLLLGIGLQEAGRTHRGELTVWPWAVNAAGVGRIFDTVDGALGWIGERRAAGISSIDVGCMQINMRWHPDAFTDARQGFDPRLNADYAARFLKDLHRKTGDWSLAAGSYHSVTPDKQAIYLTSLKSNLRLANQRIETFRAMARRAETAVAPVPPRAHASTSGRAAAQPRGSGFWSSGTGTGRAERRSIYSSEAIRPILPVFTRGD
ncbi:lytic transglycosylase domain-containing protein [Profundibacterium mesophilum]|uniref:lytic transglycosylase domain-containing protein n=1 Tax=Profundibacterium mesophilum TaxID=1258573 RepID=UPI001F3D3018|nr:lytic transglycosylase domain-containing protein [Profundibacterium mesophilum]